MEKEMLKHPEMEHEISKDDHETCEDLCEDLKEHLEMHEYPEEIQEHVKQLQAELEKYEGMEKDEDGNELKDEDDMSDEDLEKAKNAELYGEEKPKLMIKIKMKPGKE